MCCVNPKADWYWLAPRGLSEATRAPHIISALLPYVAYITWNFAANLSDIKFKMAGEAETTDAPAIPIAAGRRWQSGGLAA